MGVYLVDRSNPRSEDGVSLNWSAWREVLAVMDIATVGTSLNQKVTSENWLCNDGHGLSTAEECQRLQALLLGTVSGTHTDNCPSCGALPSHHAHCPYCGRYRGAVSSTVKHDVSAVLTDFLGRANGFCIY